MKKVLLTVDVEALPSRADGNHVDRLVFGQFAGHPSLGLREMMTEAERHSIQLTCFFDYCEYDLHGDPYLDVAREIADRGHDLQLHAHPELMSRETWARLGIPKPTCLLDAFSEIQANLLFDWLLGLHSKVSSIAPVAFRGGGYRYSANVLAAMRHHGLSISSNHNPGRPNQFDNRESCEIFRHANGVFEVPISVLHTGGARSEFNFNGYGFERMLDWFPEAFWACYANRSVLNLVMHSRSFLMMDAGKRYFLPKGTGMLELFRALLGRVNDWRAEPIGITQLAAELGAPRFAGNQANNGVSFVRSSQLNQSPTVGTDRVNAAAMPPQDVDTTTRILAGVTTHTRPTTNKAMCPVCRNPKSKFVEFNGRKLARCDTCGALERQRSLVQAWNTNLRHDIPTQGRTALLVSPAKSERQIFSALGFSSIKTLDIRPEVGCDILADLCSMPQIPGASFDVVFASHVLPHVHDLDAALSEIVRILSPDGVFLSFTPSRTGRPTTYSDGSAASGWYGVELLQKHRVGSFQAFGDLGLLRDLQRHFVVKTAMGEDPVTLRSCMWICGWKLAAADVVRTIPKDSAPYM